MARAFLLVGPFATGICEKYRLTVLLGRQTACVLLLSGCSGSCATWTVGTFAS